MDSYERISLALKRKEPDRVPVIIFTDIEKNNLSSGAIGYVREFIDAQHNYLCDELSYICFPGIGADLRKQEEPLDDGWIRRSYLNEDTVFTELLKYSTRGMYRNYRKHILNDITDIISVMGLPYIKPEANKKYREQAESFSRETRNKMTVNEFCVFEVHDPVSFLCANADPQEAAVWTLTERSLLNEYLSMLSERLLEYLEYLLKNHELNAFFIISGAEFAIPPLMSPADFEEFVMPYDRKIIELIHKYGKQVIVHCHGKTKNFIRRFIEMGADGIHPLDPAGMTGDCVIGNVKADYGREVCLIGNIQYQDFVEGTPRQMEAKVRFLMEAAKNEGGFILSPSCPLFQDNSDKKIELNIKAYIDAGLKYGAYK